MRRKRSCKFGTVRKGAIRGLSRGLVLACRLLFTNPVVKNSASRLTTRLEAAQ
jgi:hypothetical protein